MFNLYQLGWYGFQKLALTIAREIFGATAMEFLPNNDGGRDGAFNGKWGAIDGNMIAGSFVLQCKFTNRPYYNVVPSDIEEELTKIDALVKRNICDIYVLITNAGITANSQAEIESKVRAKGVKYFFVFGNDWICQIIKENPKLRRIVPRIYGLGDLSQILDSRVYSQGQALLDTFKEELSKIVLTNAYEQAAMALEKHGFVLLIGEPAAGKTTIAYLLAMGAMDQWKTPTVKLRTADSVKSHWNPEDPSQLFFVDDAFGVTQYERDLVRTWNYHFPEIKTMIKNGAKLVLTSRNYIYNRARNEIKSSAFPMLHEGEVVIDVHALTLLEKKQMLYNHMKMGTQPKEFKTRVKPFLDDIANNTRFVPETARRLGSEIFTKNLELNPWSISEFVGRQEEFLIEVIKGLDVNSKAALAMIFMNNGELKSPIRPTQTELNALQRMGGTISECIISLEAMKEVLVQYIRSEDGAYWRFKHPTIGDAFSVQVSESPEQIEIYFTGSKVARLLEQITCGDVGLEKAIIIPKEFFPLVAQKLKSYKQSEDYKLWYFSEWYAERSVLSFLSNRCSVDFIKLYIDKVPQILSCISSPSVNLAYSPQVDFAYKLFEKGLLDDAIRIQFLEKVTTYSVNGQSLDAFGDERIQQIYGQEEYDKLKDKIKQELVPKLRELTDDAISDFSEGGDADEHMNNIVENLNTLLLEFDGDETLKKAIKVEIEYINEWIDDNPSERYVSPERESLVTPDEPEKNGYVRSLFDDVDE